MFEKNAAGPGERMAETRKVLRNKSDDPRSIQEHPEVIMMKPTKGLFRALFAFAAIVFSVCVIPDVASKVHDQPSTVINVGNTIANEPEAASFGTPQRILASDGTAFEGFGGSSVAISGDTAVVGASADDVNGNTDQGSLYIFTKKNGTWTETQHLTAPDAVARMFYGISVSLSGNTLAVGTSGTPAGYNPGVYIYTRCGGLWSFQQKIVAPLDPSDPQYPDGFAQSVAVSGDTVVIGAPSDDFGSGNTTLNIGSGFVYTRTGTEWTLQQNWLPQQPPQRLAKA